jgi:hypothetical protein
MTQVTSNMFDGLAPVQPSPESVAPNQTAMPTETAAAPEVPQATEAPAAVATPPAPEPAPQPVFDPKAIFGEKYESVEKVKETLQQQEQRLKELESREPEFANEDLRFRNYALKAGFTEAQASVLKGVQDGTLTDHKDIVAANLQLKFGWDKSKVESYINRTYKLGEEFDAEDPEVMAAKDQLEMDAVIAKPSLVEAANKVQVPQKVDYASIVQQQVETWKPIMPTLIKDNSVLKVAEGIDYAVPAETLASVEKYALEVLNLEAGYDPAKHSKEMSELINKEVWYREKDNILSYVKTELEKKAIRDTANVPAPNGTTTVPKGNSDLDAIRSVLKQMADER